MSDRSSGRRRATDARRRRARTTSRPSSGAGSRTASPSSSPTCRAGRSSRRPLVLRNGAVDEPDADGGATVLAARALTEGTERYDAIALVEATERLGASIHAEAGWDAMTVGVEVPGGAPRARARAPRRGRAPTPTFPEAEVERLRDERLNDLLQAEADPRRRADEAFAATIYSAGSPYRRPSGGTTETVERPRREPAPRGVPARASTPAGRRSSSAATSAGSTSAAIAERLLGGWGARFGAGVQRTRSSPRAPSASGSSGSSIGRDRSRPRSGSATSACRGGSRTSTRCRSWARSSVGSSTPA